MGYVVRHYFMHLHTGLTPPAYIRWYPGRLGNYLPTYLPKVATCYLLAITARIAFRVFFFLTRLSVVEGVCTESWDPVLMP